MTISPESVMALNYAQNPFQDQNAPEDVSLEITKKLWDLNRYILITQNDKLIAFVESWCITYHQFGWVLCHPETYPDLNDFDVQNGNICYLANIVIDKTHRGSDTITKLKHAFFKQNNQCEFFCGEARRKRHAPVKIFKRQEFYDKYIKKTEGVIQGG